MGLSFQDGAMNIAISVAQYDAKEYGIAFFEGKKESERVVFPKECRIGDLFAVRINGQFADSLDYLFFAGDSYFMDPYARAIKGRDKWANHERTKEDLRACMIREDDSSFKSQDTTLMIPYEETIVYSLHMRGFTMHSSAKVLKKGTFAGLTEKIPYFKDLGITSVLCMPIYEFDEIIQNPAYQEIDPLLSAYYEEGKDAWKYHINFWGFCDEGNFYFAPKASYAASDNPSGELKQLIRELHNNGIEFLMQIYFAPNLAATFVLDVLRFWVMEYHVDGFQLLGAALPMELISWDAILSHTKLICENTMSKEAFLEKKKKNAYLNLATYQDAFRCDTRRFLKGDTDCVSQVANELKATGLHEAVINHITDYRGFSLLDLVSYERKHNENNGENNRDGSDYNFSWNCGVEGPSRKKNITALRLAQRKNALAMLFLAQGTPLLLAGDECGHTKMGNNNAYCQDNNVNYIHFHRSQMEEELYQFVRTLIAFRKKHKMLGRAKKYEMTDTRSCGFPDFSFHGQQAWKPQFENYIHHLAALYCGLYEEQDEFLYVAYNMHWTEQSFALPNLPNGYVWSIDIKTKEDIVLDAGLDTDEAAGKGHTLVLSARSIAVLIGRKEK